MKAAERRHVPLLTILVTVAVVANVPGREADLPAADIILLILVAGFVALLLNPLVNVLERRLVRRRGVAVAIVTILATLVFIGLALVFGIRW